MYDKVYHATHPDMMVGATNQQLRDRYLVSGLFAPGTINLNYSHNEHGYRRCHAHRRHTQPADPQ